MNGFDKARDVERRSMAILRPFIQKRSYNGQFVVTSKGPLARELQKTVGDALYNADAETIYSVEVKAEESNEHGNFFLETWSNRHQFTQGWMYTLKADLLLYHFLRDDELYKIPFAKLKKWAFHNARIYDFPERQATKYDQLNDTWGRCVPIAVVMRELSLSAPLNPAAYDYDPAKDVEGCFNDAYAAIRDRVAAGGPGWTPK